MSGMPLSRLHMPHCQDFYGEKPAGTFLTLRKRGALRLCGCAREGREATERGMKRKLIEKYLSNETAHIYPCADSQVQIFLL